MALRWHYQDDDGMDVTGPDVAFDDQAAAEDWLSRSEERRVGKEC